MRSVGDRHTLDPIWRKKPTPTTFDDLNEPERDWVAQYVAAAPAFVGELIGEEIDGQPTLEQLDAGWAAWLKEAKPEDANVVINIFGLAFGQTLVDELQMEWVVATDEDGAEMAVLGQPGNLLAYPANAVAKRWETKEAGFFVPMFEMFADVTREPPADS